MTEKKKNPSGRPSKFKEEYVELVERLCLLGHTDEELAHSLDVHVSTIYDWKNKNSRFSEAIKNGRENADMEVVRALYRRAIGGVFKVPQKVGEETVMVDRYIPPDNVAAIFWLKNRQKDKWRDKKELEGNVNIKVHADELSDDALAHIATGSSTGASQPSNGANRSHKIH